MASITIIYSVNSKQQLFKKSGRIKCMRKKPRDSIEYINDSSQRVNGYIKGKIAIVKVETDEMMMKTFLKTRKIFRLRTSLKTNKSARYVKLTI